jgi:hypothetical protein
MSQALEKTFRVDGNSTQPVRPRIPSVATVAYRFSPAAKLSAIRKEMSVPVENDIQDYPKGQCIERTADAKIADSFGVATEGQWNSDSSKAQAFNRAASCDRRFRLIGRHREFDHVETMARIVKTALHQKALFNKPRSHLFQHLIERSRC